MSIPKLQNADYQLIEKIIFILNRRILSRIGQEVFGCGQSKVSQP